MTVLSVSWHPVLDIGLWSLSGRTSYRQILWSLDRSREIGCWNDHVVLKFDRRFGSDAARVSVKFQSDWKSLNWISRFRDFTRSCGKTSVRLVNRLGSRWRSCITSIFCRRNCELGFFMKTFYILIRISLKLFLGIQLKTCQPDKPRTVIRSHGDQVSRCHRTPLGHNELSAYEDTMSPIQGFPL